MSRFDHLRKKHEFLKMKIKDLMKSPSLNADHIARLKKEKLAIKDALHSEA